MKLVKLKIYLTNQKFSPKLLTFDQPKVFPKNVVSTPMTLQVFTFTTLIDIFVSHSSKFQ